jgi:plasmid stabilization system protein ParE
MNGYQFTLQASDDLLNMWSFIARDNVAAADRVEKEIFRACDLLAEFPTGKKQAERSYIVASPILGRKALFELLDCLRSCDKTTASNPYSSCGAQSSFNSWLTA